MTNRYERMKMQRRMQRRIQLVVEERRMAFGARPRPVADPVTDPEATMEIPPMALLLPAPAAAPSPVRAIGRVSVRPV